MQFREKFKKFKISKNLNAVIDFGQIRCIIFVCIFRTIAQNLRKSELLYQRHFSKNPKSHKISDCALIWMRISTIKGAWLLHCCTKFQFDISSRLRIIVVWKLESRARTHIHTFGHQLKIILLDVLDHSDYSDTNISNIFFHQNIASSVRMQKVLKES